VDHLAWFPDNLRLLLSGFEATTLKPQLWVVSVTGSSPRLLHDDARQGMPSPDGYHIAFTTRKDSEIWVQGVTGEEPRRIVMGQSNETFPVLFWSPDGKRLAYQRKRYAPKNTQNSKPREDLENNYHWDYESAEIDLGKLVAFARNIRFNLACMLPDERMLFTRSGIGHDVGSLAFWEVKTDLASGAFLSPSRLLTSLESTKAFELTAPGDGTKIAAVLEKVQPDIYIGKLHEPGPTLVDVRKLTFDTKDDYPHGWTRDSKSIIFESNREGHYHLYRQSLDGRRAEAITTTTGEEVLPQLSPDGRWILYTVMRSSLGTPTDLLLRIPATGGSPAQIEIGGPLDEFRCPLFGSGCVLRETRGHQEFIYYALDPVKGKGRELGRTSWLPHVLGDWDVSPDGSTVALPYRDPANRKIRLVPLRAGAGKLQEKEITVNSFGTLYGLTWAADEKGWYVAVQTDVGSSLLYVNLNGESHLVRETTGGTWGVPSPDGRKLAFVDHTTDSNVWLLR
jgi:Tol biopolymer transport system component